MAQINKPSDYFNAITYIGDKTTSNSITGVGFQPDWVWIKNRIDPENHSLYDIVRGANKVLYSNGTNAENTETDGVSSFDSDGFTVGNNDSVNSLNDSHVAWNWLASNTTASNTDGSITSTVSANTTSGFSIVSYTGTGSVATVGHGLSSTPSMIIVKSRSTENWEVYHQSTGNTQVTEFTTGATFTSSARWNNTSPTSSVFTINNHGSVNTSGTNYIAYCFAEKKGFSKFGSYTGNGSTDGTFVYTGFKPSFIMIKGTSLASDWNIWDNKRPDYNVVNRSLEPHQSDAETVSAGRDIDILSNGFKARGTSSSMNSSGGSYIYMAFAESPLVGTNNIPAVAR